MTIGIIGFGNMGRAIAQGLILKGVPASDIRAAALRQDKLKAACDSLGILPANNKQAARESDIVVLAVKPWQVQDVLLGIAGDLQNKMVVSVASGVRFADLQEMLPGSARALCCIPNTPVAVGRGILICESKHSLAETDMAAFRDLFGRLGEIVLLDTKQLSAAATIAGCGPAFAALFIEALGDAGVKYGVKRDVAYRLAALMLEGTAALHLETGMHPGAMKDAVCSPGGSTIRGVSALEENGFRHAVISAVDAVENR